MPALKFIDIDGKRFLWRELLQRRREQVAAARVEQPALFEMKEDCRPVPERTAAGRYSEPRLLKQGRNERRLQGEPTYMPRSLGGPESAHLARCGAAPRRSLN